MAAKFALPRSKILEKSFHQKTLDSLESVQKSVSTAHDLYDSAVRGSFAPAQKHEIIKRLARGQKTRARHLKVKKSDNDTVF